MKYVLFLFIILFASFSDLFMFRIGIIPFTPAYFLVPLFFLFSIITFKLDNYVNCLKTNTFKFLLIFLILSVLFGLNKTVAFEEIKISIVNHLISLIVYSFCLILFTTSSNRVTRTYLLIGFTIMSLSIWYDMFFGLPVNNVYLEGMARKGGFAANPNTGASAVKFLGFGLLFLYRDTKVIKNVLLVLIFSSVFLTFSRSGLFAALMFIILLILNEWKLYFNIKVTRLIVTGIKTLLILGLLYVLLLTFADIIKEEVPAFRAGEAAERLDLLTGKSTSSIISESDRGNYGRKTLVDKYLYDFYAHPLGLGTAYCSDKSINFKNTHNFYLRTAVEYGIIGLVVLVIYFSNSIKLSFTNNNYYYFVFMILLLFECLTSHFLFYYKPIIIVLALMDSNLYFSKKENETKPQIF